jgi:membrane-associated phospholipid phosphatase
MHAGFSTMAWLYAFQVNRKFAAILGVYVFSMAFSALYLQHHYFIDVVWGMFYAVAAWYCVEKLLWRGVGRGNAWLWKNFE